jgi:CubicO group peptidase (beta-lactamase class C family)
MENIKKQFDEYLVEAREIFNLPGVAVTVSVGDKGPAHMAGLEYAKGVGVADIRTNEPVNPEDIFHIASVSKMFTACGITKLVEEGKIRFDEKLVDVLPYLEVGDDRVKDVEIWQVMCHASGMGNYEDDRWYDPKFGEDALKNYALSAEVRESGMLWHPSENRFCYSSLAYELLGLCIQERSGMTFEDYMMDRFLKPIGMDSSTFYTPDMLDGDTNLDLEALKKVGCVMSHDKDENKNWTFVEIYPYNREHAPSSCLTTTVFDLEKWGKAHLAKKVFKEETYEKIWTKHALVPNNGEHMGLGWFMREQDGYKIIGHEGTDIGFRASHWICPELDAQVTVVCNISGGAVKRISKALYGILIENAK